MNRKAGQAQQTVFFVLPKLPKSLYAAAVEPRRTRPQRPARQGSLPEQHVAYMRHEHEVGGVSVAKLALKYGVPRSQAESLLNYTNRRHIQPLPPPYWVAGPVMDKAARNKAICAASNGRNYDKLARQYGLSEGRVRAIVTAGRKLVVKGGAA